jgi:hypothetical protein
VRRKALVALVAMGALAGTAGLAVADSVISIRGGVLYFTNEDAGIGNRLTVEYDARGRVRFFDDADPYGIQHPTPPCSPGRLNSAGNPIEVFCTKGSFSSITIQIGPAEDNVTYKLDDLPATVDGSVGADALTTAGAKDTLAGGQGNDRLDGGAGDDDLRGDEGDDLLRSGDGNDRIDTGLGADRVEAGAGDDTILSADGVPDAIDCAPGTDTVSADTTDDLTSCENVTRTQVAPPPGGSTGSDSRRPLVKAGGSTRQRVSMRRRTVSIAVTADEKALVDVSGFLDAGGINDRLRPATGRIRVAGGGTLVKVRLSRTQVRRILADLRRRRRPRARVTISAVDAAGNTSRARRLTISLARR